MFTSSGTSRRLRLAFIHQEVSMFGRRAESRLRFNFSDRTRKAIAGARERAARLQHGYVGTEHLLLGLLGDDGMRTMLRQLGVSPAEIEAEVEAKLKPGHVTVALGELPYTSRAKKVLEFAMAEAREAEDNFVDTEHLLLGVVREEKGIGADVMARFGITLERARAARAGGTGPEVSRLSVHIDDASDLSIYEQIVAQVTEAVATALLRPGERLPTVRKLADDLDIAPGTVARAYGELERQGLVVTEGARGTRVAERTSSPAGAPDRPETLAGLLRPVAVAAFHLGGNAAELRAALEVAMRGIFDRKDEDGRTEG
jgi:DNA-binding transcriptional regulator YhcF (GntR family)